MKIEHLAFQVNEPAVVNEWYAAHFGFEIKCASDDPVAVRFLANRSGYARDL